ncbi:synaptogyrin-2a [Takifugu rubripes]|uniref:Synaptogyrin n=2 Tax=Takifugu TaxID=31032 RepID=A0A674NB52_TAKRU|nr:synaptogyrin-2-like [Takifugu rubripes]XP_056870496.1 synaptogyrin-2a [Takifugu flavidus]TWW70040.1 Synaptogyrin-2 [Takifugu flavidus]|eukprot:XP_003964700.1 PREDICTED: synaptogyrin-2-like [Takifugu rubripes]
MQSSAYGASLAGGAFDFVGFLKQPQTVLRCLSWLFSIVVFATITAEGYINPDTSKETNCMFNENDSACSYGVGIGIIAFLACVVMLVVDANFPQISNANQRKIIVGGDFVFSATWTLLWLICFCVLANQWAHTTAKFAGSHDAARAVIAFSFFSIGTWAILAYFAYRRYRQGVREFDHEYRDPANDHTTPYPPGPYAGSSGPSGYQQSPFSNSQEQPGEYQPPSY